MTHISRIFLIAGLCSLVLAGLLGILATTFYLFPGFLEHLLPFDRVRPLHVSAAIGWIVFSACGVVYYRLSEWKTDEKLPGLVHAGLFLISGILVLVTLTSGRFGGREYMAFPAWLGLLILGGWVLFAVTFVRTLKGRLTVWPVYLWMWGTGICFFILTYVEAHLWILPWFRDNVVREVTVQWKSYGALVGSWNMLVYGTALYVMGAIQGDDSYSTDRRAFFLYFLGLTNLLFGWAHHTYIVPAEPWVRTVAYAISMTELIVLFYILRDWRHSISSYKQMSATTAAGLLRSSDLWILINLVLALAMSIPIVNLITHGTHVTVAHAMGTTLGINTTILLAAVHHLTFQNRSDASAKAMKVGMVLFNTSLAVLFVSLLGAGISRSDWMVSDLDIPFATMMEESRHWFILMLGAGTGIVAGLVLLAGIPLRQLVHQTSLKLFRSSNSQVRNIGS